MTPDTVLLSLAAANKSTSQTNIPSNLQSHGQVNLEPEKLDHTAHTVQMHSTQHAQRTPCSVEQMTARAKSKVHLSARWDLLLKSEWLR